MLKSSDNKKLSNSSHILIQSLFHNFINLLLLKIEMSSFANIL